jgi:hypothetical protein
MKKELTIEVIAGLIGVLFFIIFPFDKWLENMNTTIITVIRIVIVIIILCYFAYKLYKWKTAKIDVLKIKELKNFGLQMENENILSEEKTLKKKNTIYFPVVPTAKPNVIHFIFAYYLKKLIASGLKVHIFVFDFYCMRIDNKQANITDEEVENFISILKKWVGNSQKITVSKENDFVKSKRKSQKVFLSMLYKASTLTLGDIKQIQQNKEHYINDSTKFARFMKPLYNILFLDFTSKGKKYGFTLSGEDEKPLWNLYNTKIGDTEGYKLCNLYIPTIKLSHAKDNTNNIYYQEQEDSILNKVQTNFSNLVDIPNDSCISLFLKLLVFGDNKTVSYKDSNNNQVNITSWDNLKSAINDNNKDNIYQSIVQNINQLMNI